MGVHQNRMRAIQREKAMGGGLTEESLTDTATDGDIMEHESGEGPAGLLGSVDLDWDEDYGPFGTRSDLPPGDPYTTKEALETASEFAQPYLPTVQDSRDVGQLFQAGTVVLQAGAPAYNIAGSDPLRKRVVVKNVSGRNADIGLAAGDVFVGTRDVQAQGGSGSYLLRSQYVDAGVGNFLNGDDAAEFQHTDEVWVIPAVYPGVTGQEVIVSYYIERYTK